MSINEKLLHAEDLQNSRAKNIYYLAPILQHWRKDFFPPEKTIKGRRMLHCLEYLACGTRILGVKKARLAIVNEQNRVRREIAE